MEKEKMNEKGFFPAIFGLAYILAAMVVLILLAAVWLFWKTLFLFGIGVAVLFFAFTTVPQMVKGKEGLKFVGITALIGGLLIIASLLNFPFLSIGGQSGLGVGMYYWITNDIITPNRPFEALLIESVNGSGMSNNNFAKFSIDEQATPNLGFYNISHCNPNLQLPCSRDAASNIKIPFNSFAGLTGKHVIRIEWADSDSAHPDFPQSPWQHVADVEVWIDPTECVLQSGKVVVAESFSAGQTITRQDLRFPVLGFCSQLPILVTVAGSVVEQRLEEYDILNKSYVTIPTGQTWTFFYIANISPEMTVVCDEGTYNPETETCDVLPGIVHVCSQGVFDPVEGLCIVTPESRFSCVLGYYDTSQQKCVYQVPAEQTIAVCPSGSQIVADEQGIKRCIYQPDSQAICLKGNYNPQTQKCEYLPETEMLVPWFLAGIIGGATIIFGVFFWLARKK